MTDRPSPSSAKPVSPLQAARKDLGLTQGDVADMIGVAVSSYIPWDQGRRRPQDPRVGQAIAEALQTSVEVLWPPEGNPVIGPKLRALREQQAARQTLAHDDHAQEVTETRLVTPGPGTAPTETGPPGASYGLHRKIEATFDGKDDVVPGASGPVRRTRRKVLIPAAASIAIVAALGTVVATTGGNEDTDRQAAPVVQAGPTAAERERTAQQATLANAKDRGDYDAAITAATRLNDTSEVAELRSAAGDVFARRARQAAERGDLPLATSRLDKGEKRYGKLPALDAVRRRIDAIKDARQKRAAERKRAAKKRAAARARAAAATRRRTPSQAATPPSSSGSQATPSSPAPSSPSQSPSPSPSPAPSSGGSSGGSKSGGGSSSGGSAGPGEFF